MPTSAKCKATNEAGSSEQRPVKGKRAAGCKSKDADRTHIFSLPPELRNTVYLLTLPIEPQIFRFSFGVHATIPALLQVNRQLRKETLGYYYGQADFDLIVHHKHFSPVRMWAQSLSQSARKHLLNNRGINLHLVLDDFHSRHDKISTFLRKRGCYLWYHDSQLLQGLYGIATPVRMERSPLEKMYNVSQARRDEGFGGKSDEGFVMTCRGPIPAHMLSGRQVEGALATARAASTQISDQARRAQAEEEEAFKIVHGEVDGAMARLVDVLSA